MTRKKYIKRVQAMGFTDARGARQLAAKANQAGFSYRDAFMVAVKVYGTILLSELISQLDTKAVQEADHESN